MAIGLRQEPSDDSATSSVRPAEDGVTAFTVAIMQPYFIPYAGYFRLFAASDLFVIYDCVQFPRRGWVHRNRLLDAAGTERWLTLPLAKAPQSVLIRDLRFPPEAARALADRLRPFPLAAREPLAAAPVLDALCDVRGSPVDYIERLLERIVAYLGLPWRVMRSSTLGVPPSLRGQDRILEIARRLGARCYLNAPGGRELYDGTAFGAAGIELRFLPDYPGPTASILTRILQEDRDALCADIRAVE
jgi:WbqC-like protein